MEKLRDYLLNDDYFKKTGNLKDFVETLLVDGNLQKVFSISDQVLEKYYQASYGLLEEQRFEEAADAFFFLVFLRPYCHAFWIGLGIAEQSQEKYENAAFAYLLAEATNIEDPIAYFNAAQCFLALGEKDVAADNVEHALEYCGEKLEFAELKTEAEQLQKVCVA